MGKQVNIHEAKTHFSKLVEEVEAGAEITIARAGKPVLKLVKFEEPVINRQIGWGAELFKDFDWDAWDALDEDMAKLWEKSLNEPIEN
jgi:prevent-host-death family protein